MLFADRARRAGARFAVAEQAGPAVARLVTRLDGMPLAIELAAARVEALGVSQMTINPLPCIGGLGVFAPDWASLRSVITWQARTRAGYAEGAGGGPFRRPAYWMRLARISPLSMAACSSVSLVSARSAKKYGP